MTRKNCLFLLFLFCFPKTGMAGEGLLPISIERFGGYPELPSPDGSWCELRDKIEIRGYTLQREIYCGSHSTENLIGTIRKKMSQNISFALMEKISSAILSISQLNLTEKTIVDWSCSESDHVNSVAITMNLLGRQVSIISPNSISCLPPSVFSLLDLLNLETSKSLGIGI